jgi:hypothetical protein
VDGQSAIDCNACTGSYGWSHKGWVLLADVQSGSGVSHVGSAAAAAAAGATSLGHWVPVDIVIGALPRNRAAAKSA